MGSREGDRILAMLTEQRRSVRWLAHAIGRSQQVVNNWLQGLNEPRDETVWIDMERILIEDAKPFMLDKPRIPVGFPPLTMRYAGEVPCSTEWGDPLASELFEEVEAEFEHPKRFCARVVGDSCWPALLPGDLTIWHSDPNPPYGLIVLAQRKGDHGCTVKKLEYDATNGRPVLLPINPHHQTPPDGDGWGVIARLVAVSRKTDGPKQTWYLPDGLRPRHLSSSL